MTAGLWADLVPCLLALVTVLAVWPVPGLGELGSKATDGEIEGDWGIFAFLVWI